MVRYMKTLTKGHNGMYYSSFGILCLTLYIIINYEVLHRGGSEGQPAAKRLYRHFMFCVIVYFCVDILWGLTYENHLIALVYADTVVYFVTMVLSVLLWTDFVVEYLQNNGIFDKILKFVGQIMFLIVVLCLVINLFYPVLFLFEADGAYRPLPVRYLFLGTQILLFAITALYTFYVCTRSSGRSSPTMGMSCRAKSPSTSSGKYGS